MIGRRGAVLLGLGVSAALAGSGSAAVAGAARTLSAGMIVYRCGSAQANLCSMRGIGAPSVRLTRDGTAETPYSSPSLSRGGEVLAYVHDHRVFLAKADLSQKRAILRAPTRLATAIDQRGERALVLKGVAEQRNIGPPTYGFTGVVVQGERQIDRPMFVAGADLDAGRVVGIAARNPRLVLSLPLRGCCGRVIFRGPYELAQPALSPDGNRLAVTAETARGTRIAIIDLRSRRLVLLAALPDAPPMRGIAWSPDSGSLIFAAAGPLKGSAPRLFVAAAREDARATSLRATGDFPTWG